MTTLQEIEAAISQLPEADYSRFRQWFLERDWKHWDHQIEADSAAGKLDFLKGEARAAKQAGTLGRLDAPHH